MAKNQENKSIPFGKAVRVGNFKLWRGRYNMSGANIECLHVSNLDGSWMIRIPATWEMYGFLMSFYPDLDSEDAEKKSTSEAVFRTVLSNMMYASCVGNGYFQRALELCATLYANPVLLNKKNKEYKGVVKTVKELIEEFLEWRKAYDAEMAKHEPTEEQLKQDEIAEQAMEALNKEEAGN